MSATIAGKLHQMETDCVKIVNYYNSTRNYNMAQQAQSLLATVGGFNTQLEQQKEPDVPFPQ